MRMTALIMAREAVESGTAVLERPSPGSPPPQTALSIIWPPFWNHTYQHKHQPPNHEATLHIQLTCE